MVRGLACARATEWAIPNDVVAVLLLLDRSAITGGAKVVTPHRAVSGATALHALDLRRDAGIIGPVGLCSQHSNSHCFMVWRRNNRNGALS